MKITQIRTEHYRIPLPVVLSDSTHGDISHFGLIVTRIGTADGLEGMGYTYCVGDIGGSAILALVRDDLAPSLIGEDAGRIERLWEGTGRHYSCSLHTLIRQLERASCIHNSLRIYRLCTTDNSDRLCLEMPHDIADRLDFLGLFVADLAAKLLFEGHYQLNQVQTVSIQILFELGIFGYFIGINIQLIHYDITNLLKSC